MWFRKMSRIWSAIVSLKAFAQIFRQNMSDLISDEIFPPPGYSMAFCGEFAILLPDPEYSGRSIRSRADHSRNVGNLKPEDLVESPVSA